MRSWVAVGVLLLACGGEGAPLTPETEEQPTPQAGKQGEAGAGTEPTAGAPDELGGTGGNGSAPSAGAPHVGGTGGGGSSGRGGSAGAPAGAGGRAAAGSSSGGPSVAGKGGTGGMGGKASAGAGGKAGNGGTAGEPTSTGGTSEQTRSLLGCGKSSNAYVCSPDSYLWACPDDAKPTGNYTDPGRTRPDVKCVSAGAGTNSEWCCEPECVLDSRVNPDGACTAGYRPFQCNDAADGDYVCLGGI
jgi:hypothetical protein